MKNMSLRLRLTILYTGVLCLTLVAFSFIVYIIMTRTLYAEVDSNISAMASSVVKSAKISKPLFEQREIILPNVDVFSSPGTYLQVLDSKGRLLGRSSNLGPQFFPMSEDTLRVAAEGRVFYETVQYGTQRIRIFNYPMLLDGNLIGILQVGRSLSQMDMILKRLKLMMLFGALGTVLSAGLIGWTLASAAFRPVERIIKSAASIQRGSDLKRRIDYHGPRDELYTLAETLNDMLERMENVYSRLEEINEAQRSFVADASHELRTPLTTIRGNAELLIKMGDIDPITRGEALADIAGEAERLTRLVSNLLYLARADAGQVIEKSQAPLKDIMERAVSGIKFLTERKINTIGIDSLQEGTLVDVNPDLIIQAVNILLDNAIKYTPEEGQISLGVRLGGNGGDISIFVKDTGPGIPPEDREEIFKRFYRGRSARGKSGSGLGLSIAQWILQKHGGRVELESEEGKGSVFELVLPTA